MENKIGRLLKWIGTLIIGLGIVLGIVSWFAGKEAILSGLLLMVSAFIFGMIFIGLAEVLRLLEILQIKLIVKKEQKLSQTMTAVTFTNERLKDSLELREMINWHFTDKYKESILRNYPTNGKRILDVIPTPITDYCIVNVEGDLHVVYNKNFLAIRVTEENKDQHKVFLHWYKGEVL